MCEFCGCGVERPLERPARSMKVRGKPLGVRVVAVATGPTAPRATDATAGEERRAALVPTADEHVAPGGV